MLLSCPFRYICVYIYKERESTVFIYIHIYTNIYMYCTRILHIVSAYSLSPLHAIKIYKVTMKIWRRQWQPTLVLFAWKIPWTGEPAGLQSMGLQRVGHDWTTSLHSLYWLHTLSLEKEMATHSSTLAWRTPWTEDPGGPWSRGRRESDVTEHAYTMKI